MCDLQQWAPCELQIMSVHKRTKGLKYLPLFSQHFMHVTVWKKSWFYRKWRWSQNFFSTPCGTAQSPNSRYNELEICFYWWSALSRGFHLSLWLSASISPTCIYPSGLVFGMRTNWRSCFPVICYSCLNHVVVILALASEERYWQTHTSFKLQSSGSNLNQSPNVRSCYI